MAFRRTTGRFTANLQSTTPRFFWDGTDNRKDAFGLVIIAVEEVLSSRDQGFDRGKEFIVRNFTAKVIIDVGRLGGGSHVQYPLWKNA